MRRRRIVNAHDALLPHIRSHKVDVGLCVFVASKIEIIEFQIFGLQHAFVSNEILCSEQRITLTTNIMGKDLVFFDST